MHGISTIKKEAPESSLAPSAMWGYKKNMQPGRELLPNHPGTLISDFQAPGLRNKFLFSQAPQFVVFYYSKPNKLRQYGKFLRIQNGIMNPHVLWLFKYLLFLFGVLKFKICAFLFIYFWGGFIGIGLPLQLLHLPHSLYILILEPHVDPDLSSSVLSPQFSIARGCPNPRRAFTSIPGLYLVDDSSAYTLSSARCDNRKGLQTLPDVPWRAKLPPVETCWFKHILNLFICLLCFLISCSYISDLCYFWTVIWIISSLPLSSAVSSSSFL